MLSRTTWELERVQGDEEKVRAELDCARLFVDIAYRRARRNIRALRGGQDGRMKALAERALETLELAPEAPTDR